MIPELRPVEERTLGPTTCCGVRGLVLDRDPCARPLARRMTETTEALARAEIDALLRHRAWKFTGVRADGPSKARMRPTALKDTAEDSFDESAAV